MKYFWIYTDWHNWILQNFKFLLRGQHVMNYDDSSFSWFMMLKAHCCPPSLCKALHYWVAWLLHSVFIISYRKKKTFLNKYFSDIRLIRVYSIFHRIRNIVYLSERNWSLKTLGEASSILQASCRNRHFWFWLHRATGPQKYTRVVTWTYLQGMKLSSISFSP